MKHYFPKYCEKFRCIANLCPDSCCKDWDVVVDDTSFDFYNTAKGEFGDRLRSLMTIDEDGDRIFIKQGEKCPFWNSDMLCDIYINLGENHLCHTCKEFPRITQDYTVFCEHTLSFACPEAARFMLRADESAYADFGGSDELSLSEDSDDYMSFLLKTRERTVETLLQKDVPFSLRLADCLDFNAKVQSVLDGEEPEPLEIGDASGSDRFIFDMHLQFEIMSDTWKAALTETAALADRLVISEDFARDFEKFALYYTYRYYLEAVNSGDVLYAIKRIVCAYLVTGKMDAVFAQKGYPLSRMRILQRYSKEVEHSYDNTEKLNAEFDADSRFSVENLIAMLEGMA